MKATNKSLTAAQEQDKEDVQDKESHVGSLTLINKTLQGIAIGEKPKQKPVKDATDKKPFSSEEHSGKQTHSPQSRNNVSRE